MNRTLRLNWRRSAEDIAKRTTAYLSWQDELVQSICDMQQDDVGFEQVKQLAYLDAKIARESIEVVLPAFCASNDPAVRSASMEAKTKLLSMWQSRAQNRKLYDKLKNVTCPAGAGPQDQRLLNVMFKQFEKNGAALSEELNGKVTALREEQAQLCGEFEQTINECTDSVKLSESEVKDLSPSQVSKLSTTEQGQLEVGLKFPEVFPLLTTIKDEGVRRKLDVARLSRCPDNLNRLSKLLKIRHEAATMLGYGSHADYMMDGRLAKSSESVREFLTSTLDLLRSKAQAQVETLAAFKAQLMAEEDGVTAGVKPWDVHFLTKKQKEELYSYDDVAVSEYFPLPHVLQGIFDMYSELLGVEFEELDDDVWDESVRMFQVTDQATKEVLGYFFLDLFPRDGKYSHQCVLPITPCFVDEDGTKHLPAVAMVGNFPKPTEDQPQPLLRHTQVETLFHEFGHVMHGVCTNSKYSLFSWAWSAVPWPGGVEYDFLETPSMMFQNWVWEVPVLQMLSSHVETKLKLPTELAEKVISARQHNKAWAESRYMALALVDLELHSSDVHADTAMELYNKYMKQYGLLDIPDDDTAHFLSTFYHLVMGYDAGYYSYAWSEAYSDDLCLEFKTSDQGLLNPVLGRRFRDCILEPGATVAGTDMIRRFLGREPSTDPFIKRLLSDS
eukprot:m.18824 g.18824  ORF g.18824 m.18824 type:complete len:671 (-) comp7952_c0_seq2:122-2134(-)